MLALMRKKSVRSKPAALPTVPFAVQDVSIALHGYTATALELTEDEAAEAVLSEIVALPDGKWLVRGHYEHTFVYDPTTRMWECTFVRRTTTRETCDTQRALDLLGM